MQARPHLVAAGLRLLLYGTLATLGLEAVVRAAEAGLLEPVTSEDGTIEKGQVFLALGTAGVLMIAAGRRPDLRTVLRLLALAALFAVVRELDGFLDSHWFKGAYKYLNAPIVLAFVVIAFKHRRDLLAELGRAGLPLSMVLMFLGFFLVVGYSQVLGQKELWQAAMGEDYLRLVKNTVEESSELVGFLMILFGAVEAALFEPGRSA